MGDGVFGSSVGGTKAVAVTETVEARRAAARGRAAAGRVAVANMTHNTHNTLNRAEETIRASARTRTNEQRSSEPRRTKNEPPRDPCTCNAERAAVYVAVPILFATFASRLL